MCGDTVAGYSIIELVFVTALAITVGATAVPPMLTGVEEMRVAGATRYVTARLQQTRMEAVVRSRTVALQFVSTSGTFAYTVYVDGNGDGVRTRDIQRGIDRPLAAVERLSDRFTDIEFGLVAGLPGIDPGDPPPGTDPIKLGTSNILSFSAMGTSTSGSLYIRGRRNTQCAIRVFGETGKVRALRYDSRTRQWKPL